MHRFHYERALDVDDALRKATARKTVFIGGGTSLIDLMKLRLEMPERVVDVNHAGLDDITELPTGIRIGGACTMAAVATHPAVVARFPLLSQALLAGATPQLRHAATIAGNLQQRPRCFYFRESGFRCNKRSQGSGCDALFGDNESHAIFGRGDNCIAVAPSDMSVALLSLSAAIEARAITGTRRIPIDAFFVSSEADISRETVIEPGELIVAVELTDGPLTRYATYFKVPPAGGFSIVSAAVSLDIEGDVIRSARIAMGGVAHAPWRAHHAESRVVGRTVSETTWQQAAAAEMSRARGRGRNDYKIALGREVLRSALAKAAESRQ